MLLIQNNFDLNYAKNTYEDSGNVEGVDQVIRERLFELVLEKRNEYYSKESFRCTKKDKGLVVRYIDEIEKSTLFKVDFDILERFRNILKECGPALRK